MTLHVTEIERVRPLPRPSWRTVASNKQRAQTHETLSHENRVFAEMEREIAQAMEAIR